MAGWPSGSKANAQVRFGWGRSYVVVVVVVVVVVDDDDDNDD
jgi:hypothetical protein